MNWDAQFDPVGRAKSALTSGVLGAAAQSAFGKAAEWLAAQRGRPVGLSQILPPEARNGQLKPLLPAKPEPKPMTWENFERRIQQQSGWTDDELEFYAGRSHTPPADSQYNRPLWSKGSVNPLWNALIEHMPKHEREFPPVPNYVQQAHDFFSDPPADTEVRITRKGKLFLYHEPENRLMIIEPGDAIRTFFVPDEGRAYFDSRGGVYAGRIDQARLHPYWPR